jgi:dipeptidyl-peptidase-3
LVHGLQYSEAWTHLSKAEKNYAYFLSKAAWEGALMVPHQISYEAPAIMLLFLNYFQTKDMPILKKSATDAGVSEEDWRHFIVYAGGFFSNMSNYQAFGHNKFIPECSPEAFAKILSSNPLVHDDRSSYKRYFEQVYPQVERELFAMGEQFKVINLP